MCTVRGSYGNEIVLEPNCSIDREYLCTVNELNADYSSFGWAHRDIVALVSLDAEKPSVDYERR